MVVAIFILTTAIINAAPYIAAAGVVLLVGWFILKGAKEPPP